MADIRDSERILDVKFVHLATFADERGRFVETFRREWFPDRRWDAVQANRSDSRRGVLRGLHFHHRQIDYWYLAAGRIRVGLFDLRRSSPTRGAGEILDVSEANPVGIYVPVGVGHGFLALEDSVLTYVVDNYYDASDEFGVAWNDPDMGLAWGVTDPLLSPRDRANPSLRDLDAETLPG